MEVQSVMFDRNIYNKQYAEKWLREHNMLVSFHGKGVDVTANYLRYRQQPPSKFKAYTVKEIKRGIKFVMGKA